MVEAIVDGPIMIFERSIVNGCGRPNPADGVSVRMAIREVAIEDRTTARALGEGRANDNLVVGAVSAVSAVA